METDTGKEKLRSNKKNSTSKYYLMTFDPKIFEISLKIRQNCLFRFYFFSFFFKNISSGSVHGKTFFSLVKGKYRRTFQKSLNFSYPNERKNFKKIFQQFFDIFLSLWGGCKSNMRVWVRECLKQLSEIFQQENSLFCWHFCELYLYTWIICEFCNIKKAHSTGKKKSLIQSHNFIWFLDKRKTWCGPLGKISGAICFSNIFLWLFASEWRWVLEENRFSLIFEVYCLEWHNFWKIFNRIDSNWIWKLIQLFLQIKILHSPCAQTKTSKRNLFSGFWTNPTSNFRIPNTSIASGSVLSGTARSKTYNTPQPKNALSVIVLSNPKEWTSTVALARIGQFRPRASTNHSVSKDRVDLRTLLIRINGETRSPQNFHLIGGVLFCESPSRCKNSWFNFVLKIYRNKCNYV